MKDSQLKALLKKTAAKASQQKTSARAAFVLSIVGTEVGVYAGRRLANHWGF